MRIELKEIKQIRLEEDWSYQQLANAIGMRNQSSVHRLLTGKYSPTERTLYKIRRYLAKRKLATQQAAG